MANRNKEIKDVVDLRSLKHKKFLSEWRTWVAGTYNIRKATIDNNTTVEFGRKVVANNNETANKVQIDKLKVDKADKTEVMKKDVDGSYTALLTTDKVSPMVANQTGFPQNDLYSAVVDLKDPNKVLFNGYSKNFFYTENNGDLYNPIDLDTLPETIQFEKFDFHGVISVDSDEIKAFAWIFFNAYNVTKIYKTKDMKNWEYDSSIGRIDGINKVFIKDRRIWFHTGNVTYSWNAERYTALRSRSIDEYNGAWLVHWNIANDRTTHDIPRPQVDQYGADGIRFSTFAKYNDKIYDVLFYDRNNHFSASPNPDSYQIWIKPIDGNSICTINIGQKFSSVYSGSAIVQGNYMFIILSQGFYASVMSIYKVNLLDGTYELVKEINYNSLKYTEINSDDIYFYLKNETCKHFLKIAFNGDTIEEIQFIIENGATAAVSANIFGWAGNRYFVAKQGLQVCLFEYINNKLMLKKRYSNPCHTVDINYSENLNSDFLIADNFGNKRLSNDNGKSWSLTSSSKTVDVWVIPFNSDDGTFQVGDKITWSGLTVKHIRGATVVKQYTFPLIEDYCTRTYTYLQTTTKNIQGVYVGKTGKIFISFYYRNTAKTSGFQSIFLFNFLNEIEDTSVMDLPPAYYIHLDGKHYNFDYMKSYFKDFNKAIITEGVSCILLNFETGTIRGNLRGSLSFNKYENIISNQSDFIIQQNEYSGSMNTKDIVVMFNNETYVQVKLPYLPAKVKIQRMMKKIGNKFFLFYANGMAFCANEADIISDPSNAFSIMPTDILGKLNDISFNGTFWLAVGEKGKFRISENLIDWFSYDVSRYNSPESNMFGFDITKENLKPTRSIDFKIDGSSRMSLDKTYKTLKTINGIEGQIIKTEVEGIDENIQSDVSDYGELTLNNVDVKYEKMEYSGTYNAIAGTSVKVCRIPYNWRGKRIVVEFEARKTNSTVNALASFCYDGTSVVIKECKQNKDNATWVKYLGTIVLPSNWDKTKTNGYKFSTDLNTTMVGAYVDISVANGNWDVKNIKVTLGEISRPLQFATDSSECHLFNVPEAWRGCELEITYDLYNKGGERGTSVDVFNGHGVSNWIIRGSEDLGTPTGKAITKSGFLPYSINTLATINNTFKDLLYKSPRLGATFFTRSLNSKANTLDFFQQNGFTINFLAGKTISELTYFDFGISGGGNIIVGSSGIEFKNFKAKIKSIENTFDFFETGGVTFGDTSKFTFEELITEKNIK